MTIESIIGAIIIGAIIGVLARLVLPGRQNISVWLTVLVGIVAALIGSFLADLMGVKDTKGFDWIEFLFQLVLAVIGVAAVSGANMRRSIR